MFRMKSNAVLLTIITTVSGLAIGLLSLSYISYYSAEKSAELYVPADFSITNTQDAEKFKKALTANHIGYTDKTVDVLQVAVNTEKIMDTNLKEMNAKFDPKVMTLPVISERAVDNIQLSADETLFTDSSGMLQKFMPMKDAGAIELKGQHEVIPQQYKRLHIDAPISGYFTSGGLPVAIVDEAIFERLKKISIQPFK